MPSVMRKWRTKYDYLPQGMSGRRADVVETGASQVSAIEENVRLRDRDRWQDLIDNTLIEMGRDPSAFEDADEGIAAPTKRAVDAAVEFARFARDEMWVAPGQTLPDGEGGLVIQHALPDGATVSFEADANGNCSIWHYPRAPEKPTQFEFGLGDDGF